LSDVDVGNSGVVEIDSRLAACPEQHHGHRRAPSASTGRWTQTGTSSIIDANISIATTGLVESTSGRAHKIDPDAAVGITNHGTLEAEWR